MCKKSTTFPWPPAGSPPFSRRLPAPGPACAHERRGCGGACRFSAFAEGQVRDGIRDRAPPRGQPTGNPKHPRSRNRRVDAASRQAESWPLSAKKGDLGRGRLYPFPMTQPHNAPTNRAEWSDLFEELDRWGESGRMATLWWRDDDVTAPNDRLDRLLAIAGEVPVTLAVTPAMAAPELVPWLARRAAHIAVVQHGWRHANHAAGRGAGRARRRSGPSQIAVRGARPARSGAAVEPVGRPVPAAARRLRHRRALALPPAPRRPSLPRHR